MKKLVLAAIICASFCACIAGAADGDKPSIRPERLSRAAHAADEVTKDRAADRLGMDRAEYRRIAERDRSLKIDGKNKSLYACAAPARSLTGLDSTHYTDSAPFAYDQTFKLHTRPGATRIIYLDFDGHTTSGTDWNDSETRGNDFTTPAFDTDGDSLNFSDAEKAMVQNIWRRVAEDYAPFDIDVTTEDPGVDAIRQSGEGDTTWGIRAVIGGNSSQWFSGGAGGVAYVGSFGSSIDTPVYIFSDDLSSDEKWIAEAVSHEVGHSVGLNHMGQSSPDWVEYYDGHADWAPIMGVGYDRAIVQWSKGEYRQANNTEDAVAIISTYAPRLALDHGTDSTSAQSVLVEPSFTLSGVIVSQTDQAWYKITTESGTLDLEGLSAAISPNLKFSLSLANAEGVIFASSPLTSEMGATLSTGVSTGTYYIIVDGIGAGNPQTAFSDYGSLGRFAIQGSFQPSAFSNLTPLASMFGTSATLGTVPLSVQFVGSGSTDTDGTVTSHFWDFGDGTSSTEINPLHSYKKTGSYLATLQVRDNFGYIGTTSIPVTVTPALSKNTPALSVSSLKTSWVKSGKSNLKARALATIVDQRGKPFPNAKISYQTITTALGSAPVSTTGSVLADKKGSASLLGEAVPTTFRGDVQFTILSIESKGYVYNSAANKVTAGSVSR